MSKDQIRNWLNIILFAMCFKIAESSLRMIK